MAALLLTVIFIISGLSSCLGNKSLRQNARDTRRLLKPEESIRDMWLDTEDMMVEIMDIFAKERPQSEVITSLYVSGTSSEFYKYRIEYSALDGSSHDEPVVETTLLDSDEKVSIIHLFSLNYNGIYVTQTDGSKFNVARRGAATLYITQISDKNEIEYYRSAAEDPEKKAGIYYFKEYLDGWCMYVSCPPAV